MKKASNAFLSYNCYMQQFFYNNKLNTNDIIRLNDDVLYHLKKVLRKGSDYTFRLVDIDGKIFHCHLIDDNNCVVDKYLDENNELDINITCILSLIKSDKLELCIQKLTELGVNRIVLYDSIRSVMKIKDEKKLSRFEKIALEAAQQSHRNRIPEIKYIRSVKDMKQYMSEDNYICYESEDNIVNIEVANDITFVIGPEGGFELNEYNNICELGFKSISLGKRILRAETAAIYMSSVIVSKCQ